MLAGYDAKAVADVLGIAFMEAGHGDKRDPTAGTFVAEVDGQPVQVVARGGNTEGMDVLPMAGDAVRPPSSFLIERAVERGLPRLVLRHVAGLLAGDDAAKVSALEWGVVPRTTLERRNGRLSPQESERTERVARLFVHARRALGTDAEARQFMTTPHPQLDGRSPLDAAMTDLGARRAEHILNALEYGLAV